MVFPENKQFSQRFIWILNEWGNTSFGAWGLGEHLNVTTFSDGFEMRDKNYVKCKTIVTTTADFKES